MKQQKKFTMIDMKYPYGKSQVYLKGSTLAAMSRLIKSGYDTKHVDLNFEELDENSMSADYFGISVNGAPYIPDAILLIKELSKIGKPILLGGQTIERLEIGQFEEIFHGVNVKQIRNDNNLAQALNCSVSELLNPYEISQTSVLKTFSNQKLKNYMVNEMTMIISQGCHFKCAFCAASKAQKEKFKSLECFIADIRFLAQSARSFGIKELQFYASSLDFFQNPKIIFLYLEEIVKIQKEFKVKFKIRCLSCTTSFLSAVHSIGKDNFKELMKNSGLWCVGFGVDGADEKVWKAQKKNQNNFSDIKDCLDLTKETRITAEILMVMGFPQDTARTLFKCVTDSIKYVWHWPNVILRPYLAKPFVPGNDEWKKGGSVVENFVSNPKKFYNLDFCALGSKSTDVKFWHRTWSNLAYLSIIGIFTPIGKCVTSPLLPQGSSGLYGKIAKFINKLVPFDR